MSKIRIKPRTLAFGNDERKNLFQKVPLAALALVTLTLLVPTAHGQSVRFRSGQTRVTVPLNYSGSNPVTNAVTLSGTVNPENFTVTGLPAGATANISPASLSASGTITITLNTTNVAEGLYTLSLNGTGDAANTWLFNLQVGDVWNGSATGGNNWSSSASWTGGTVPGASDDVLFTQTGAPSSATITNIIVDTSTEVASLRFSQTNSSSYYHTLRIDPGVTLSVTGPNGFNLLRDYINELSGITSSRMFVTINGSGGSLVVSNESANIGVLLDGQINTCNLNMSDLGNFITDVSRIGLAEFQLYPNVQNYLTDNNYPNGIPRRFDAVVSLARTNVVKAVFADPFNYTNEFDRGYGLSYVDSETSGTGSSPVNNLNLGISNAFFVDSVCFVRANHQGFAQFNSAYASLNPVAIFRGTNGGRMSVFTISDDGGTNAASSNVKGTVNFGPGTVDILADRLYLARDRSMIASNQTPNVQAVMYVGAGKIDVNTAILGYQEHQSKTNWTVISGGTAQPYLNYCQGSLYLTNGVVMTVNSNLVLGYTADTNQDMFGGYSAAEQYNTRGQVTVANGSSLLANNIQVDGGLNLSGQNTITLTNSGALIVSNAIGSSVKSLASLSAYAGSAMTLFVDSAATQPIVFTTNLTCVGSNALIVAQLANIGAASAVPLIRYANAPSGSFTPILPGGLVGALVDDNLGTIYLDIITNAPKSLVWRGYASGDWNQTDANWLDLDTGLHTNFVTGDSVAFDDATSATNINITDANMIASQFNITNSANYYTFSGSGSVLGATPVNKYGTGTLEVDCKIGAAIQLNEGTLVGSGSGAIGAVTVAPGATMNYNAIFAGLVCNGTATIQSSGSGSGIMTVSGIVTNQGSFSGQFTVLTNGYLYNYSGLHSVGASAVNGTLVNAGTIGDDGVIGSVAVNSGALFEDLGIGSLTLDELDINSGATFIPGGDGIGTTTVLTTHNSGNVGMVRLLTGSTSIFKVNLTNTQPYTTLLSTRIVFGPSQSTKAQNGCTLVISNVGPTAFTAGNNLQLFGNSAGAFPIGNAGKNTTNAYPVIIPPSPNYPTLGLRWDPITDLYPDAAFPLGGQIDILGVAVNSTNVTFNPSFLHGTNIVADLQWPADHTGWRLQTQTDPLTVGISTNWTDVFGSTLTNEMVFTNVITTNCVFYRLVYP